MQVFVVESLYCRENATKKVSFRRLVCNTHLLLVPFHAPKGTSISPQACIFLAHPSISLFLFLSQKEQVSLKLVSFLHTNNHNKSTTLVDCASNLCDASHFFNCLASCDTILNASFKILFLPHYVRTIFSFSVS